MGIFAVTDVRVEINSVNLTDHLTDIDVDDQFAELLTTNMASGGNTERIAGLRDGKITLMFQQDFASAKVYATISPLLGTLTTIKVRPHSTSISATNPSFEASYLISNWKPVAGKVGELDVMQVTWPRSGGLSIVTS